MPRNRSSGSLHRKRFAETRAVVWPIQLTLFAASEGPDYSFYSRRVN